MPPAPTVVVATSAPSASSRRSVVPEGAGPPLSSSTVPETSEISADAHSWKLGMPESTESVNMIEVIAAVGRNHPEAPAVSVPVPTSVDVAGFQVGTFVCWLPPQDEGRGVEDVQ